ncbi:bifunctional phosphoglucose/phosphomannose isomerase [Candidatus Saganbacteria bacterium]|nr:bifunctional phosphoglucose/phosphomannose isomerase [Candidatus Saganbacteria bacterium]
MSHQDNNIRLDASGMLDVVLRAPADLIETYKIEHGPGPQKKFDGIVIGGMGGSAIAGNVISDLFSQSLKISIYVCRRYVLPANFTDKSLFIAISYSGNTEETLSAMKDAESRGMQILCITSGGKLRDIAQDKKYQLIEIKKELQPRAAFYIILTSLLKALEGLKIIPSQGTDVIEAAKVLENMRPEMQRPDRTNEIKQLAQKIKDKVPLIFTSAGVTEAAGRRMKTQLNENSKLSAFMTVFPEVNHNEIVGYAGLKKQSSPYSMIVLRDEDEHIRINKRIEITKSLIGSNLGGINEIRSRGKSRLARILSLIFYGDVLSVYTAFARGMDPTPVDIIEKLKKELNR